MRVVVSSTSQRCVQTTSEPWYLVLPQTVPKLSQEREGGVAAMYMHAWPTYNSGHSLNSALTECNREGFKS